MVVSSALPRRYLLPLLLAPALLLAEPAADTSGIPTEPPRPNLRGLSPEQQRQVSKSYRTARREWEKTLPASEKAKLVSLNTDHDMELALRVSVFHEEGLEEALLTQTLSMPWRESAVRAGLSPAEIERLAREKVLIEDRQVPQSFSPYIDPERAVFVTTDSLLNGFHVLLQDSICELERHRAIQLRQQLESLIPHVKSDCESLKSYVTDLNGAEAIRTAEMIIGPAIGLLGGSLETIAPENRAEVMRQTELIRLANSQETPAWFESPGIQTKPIDYRQCLPTGYYKSDATLADYFRAFRWLQLVPFRACLDHELLAAALLDRCRDSAFFDDLSAQTGTTDIDTFEPFCTIPYSLPQPFIDKMTAVEFFARARRTLNNGNGPLYFSLTENGDTTDTDSANLLQFASSRFLDPATAFGRREVERIGPPPDSLTIAAAINSAFARSKLPQPVPPREDLINLPELFAPGTSLDFHVAYLNTLSSVTVPTDDAAPAFMKSEAWAAKSCLTVLAGWTQSQHLPTRQYRSSGFCDCDTFTLPGFVEPTPEFFFQMADLAAGTAEYFSSRGAFSDERPLPVKQFENEEPAERAPDRQLSERWLRLIRLANQLAQASNTELQGKPVDQSVITNYGHILGFVMGYAESSWMIPRDDAPRWAEVHRQPTADRTFAIGTGRPRLIHVLYPYEGREVLCTGSVMSYYEYWENGHLTDEEWKAKLDSPAAPPPPDWLTPFMAR